MVEEENSDFVRIGRRECVFRRDELAREGPVREGPLTAERPDVSISVDADES
jgi:hypothetical protein